MNRLEIRVGILAREKTRFSIYGGASSCPKGLQGFGFFTKATHGSVT